MRMKLGGRDMARDTVKEKFWQAKIAEYEKSGLTVRKFCGECGLREVQFYYWRRELKSDGESGKGFIELLHSGAESKAAGVSVRIDERISIVLERGFDLETLKAALSAVAAAGGL